MLNRFFLICSLFLLTACAVTASPPIVEAKIPKAILRVAADSGYVTNIGFERNHELRCGSTEYMLGWFHPSATSTWQRDRRLFATRQNMLLSAHVPENMYSEHAVAIDRPFFLQFGAALTNCSGVVKLDLKQERQYEFLLINHPGVCTPKLYEFQKEDGVSGKRVEIPLATPIRSFQCGS